MIAKAHQNNVRVSAKKAKLVCDLIRHKKVADAFKILQVTPQKSAKLLFKLLSSAVANAVNNHSMNGESLYVFHAVANQGRTFKKTLPRAKGRSDLLRKRTTNFVIQVSDDLNERKKMNFKLLKPRAHQHKVKVVENPKAKQSIAVETKVIDNKGAVR